MNGITFSISIIYTLTPSTKKSFVVYETIRDLEKMGDQDWADVRRFCYCVCCALWEPVTFHLCNKFS
jgi:hypothetical protein